MDNLYIIPEQNMSALKEALGKLNAKAKKLGCPLVTYEVLTVEKKKVVEDDGFSHYELYHHVAINGEAPQIPGWRFEGVVETGEEISGYLTRRPFGATPLPEEFRASLEDSPCRCDHCRTDRLRYRTFIVRNTDSGEFKLVGGSCLRDYTGHRHPGDVGAYYEWIAELAEKLEDDEAFGGCYRGPRLFDIVDFLAVVCALARTDGFVTRSEATDSYTSTFSTSDKAIRILEDGKWDGVTDLDRQLASSIAEFLPSLWEDKGDLNDFLINLRNSFSSGLVSSLTAGVIAAAYPVYQRNRLRELLKGSDYQGSIKQRLSLGEVTCYAVKVIEGYYGVSLLCKFHDSNGNIFTWFNSGRREVEAGQRYILRGTVKSHNEYNGVRETQLTRCHLS